MATYLGTYEAGSPEWRAHRQGKIGGSDIAAILGLSKWQSAYSLWFERRGDVPPPPEKPQMTWGTLLEPVIAQHFASQHLELMVDYQPGQVWAHPDRPWQVASPDALIGTSPFTVPPTIISGLEVKTSRYDDGWGKEGTADIPAYYSTQVQWCMDVFGVDEWHVAALFAGSDYRPYVVRANPMLQELLRETASDFLDSIEQGKVPPVDGHETTFDTVKRLHPEIEDEDVEVGDLGRAYVQSVRTLSEAETAAREAKSLLADFMGNAKRATLDGERIAYRKNTGAGRPPTLVAVNGLLDKVSA